MIAFPFGQLAYCHDFGIGVPKDDKTAFSHYKIAADAEGLFIAQVKVGLEMEFPETTLSPSSIISWPLIKDTLEPSSILPFVMMTVMEFPKTKRWPYNTTWLPKKNHTTALFNLGV